MMKYSLHFLLCLITFNFSLAQDKPAYTIFDANGRKVSYTKLLRAANQSEMIFFGEYHNNPIVHWLQYELTKDLAQLNDNRLTLGFEMFEADQQQILDDYLAGMIVEKIFTDSTRLWSNYQTDYRPLVQLAKENSLRCIASNIPRRIANLVFKKGRTILDSLEQQEYAFMCDKNFPVDYELSQYKQMLEMTSDHTKGLNFINAQAIKDATMAYFSNKLWKPGTKFIHFNGAYHTDFYQGIIWYMQRLKEDLRYTSISVVEQENIAKLDKEYLGKAHYIICVPSSMTKTH